MKNSIIAPGLSASIQSPERRNFFYLVSRLGLGAAALGLSGGLFGCGSNISQAKAGQPGHHTPDGFVNPPGSPAHEHGFSDLAGHFWFELNVKNPEPPSDHFLGHRAAAEMLAQTGPVDKITWLGHSAFLIRLSGANILIDPFLSDVASPLAPLGPKRFTPPVLPVEMLPKIDVVLISHNHYDHLDKATLTALPNRDSIPVIVPLGLKNLLVEMGFRNVTELDWQDTKTSGQVKITSVPAVHFSGRGLFDRNKTLWTGYAVSDGRVNFYFCGDTAYHPTLFKQIGQQYGPFDYGLVTIGAYEPRSIMISSHSTPEKAVEIGRDVKAKRLIPIHWGTIILSQEPPFEPPQRFMTAGLGAGYDRSDLWKMRVGETRKI